MPPIRVFLVDDHEVVRRGLAALFDGTPGLEVVGEAATAASAIQRINATVPDVVVLDVRLPDGSGVEVCRRFAREAAIRSHSDSHLLLG